MIRTSCSCVPRWARAGPAKTAWLAAVWLPRDNLSVFVRVATPHIVDCGGQGREATVAAYVVVCAAI